MFANKVINDSLISMIGVIGIVNLYLMATQTIWVVAIYACELLVLRYLNTNLKRKATAKENLMICIIFWIIPVIIYFLVPTSNKRIYISLFESYFT